MGLHEEIESVFSPIADTVVRFAELHSFRIDKYVRDNAGWELTRSHPTGGAVTLLLLYDTSLGLGIGSVWQFPCPEMSRLYSHFRDIRPCDLASHDVATVLDREMREIMEVRFGYWTHISPLNADS